MVTFDSKRPLDALSVFDCSLFGNISWETRTGWETFMSRNWVTLIDDVGCSGALINDLSAVNGGLSAPVPRWVDEKFAPFPIWGEMLWLASDTWDAKLADIPSELLLVALFWIRGTWVCDALDISVLDVLSNNTLSGANRASMFLISGVWPLWLALGVATDFSTAMLAAGVNSSLINWLNTGEMIPALSVGKSVIATLRAAVTWAIAVCETIRLSKELVNVIAGVFCGFWVIWPNSPAKSLGLVKASTFNGVVVLNRGLLSPSLPPSAIKISIKSTSSPCAFA